MFASVLLVTIDKKVFGHGSTGLIFAEKQSKISMSSQWRLTSEIWRLTSDRADMAKLAEFAPVAEFGIRVALRTLSHLGYRFESCRGHKNGFTQPCDWVPGRMTGQLPPSALTKTKNAEPLSCWTRFSIHGVNTGSWNKPKGLSTTCIQDDNFAIISFNFWLLRSIMLFSNLWQHQQQH